MRTIRRQYSLKKQHWISDDAAEGLARALGTTVEWLLYGKGEEETAVARIAGRGLPVIGTVQTRRWMESHLPQETADFTMPHDPQYPEHAQYAMGKRGVDGAERTDRSKKNTLLSLRINVKLKAALQRLADLERRTLSNYVEILLEQHVSNRKK